MHFSRAISLINTPSDNARRAQLARGRLAGKGWTSDMKRAVPAVAGMLLILLAGPILHHQFQPLAGNVIFLAALGSVLISTLGIIIVGDRDARVKAQAELSSSWAEAAAQSHAQRLGAAALALLSSLRASSATQAITNQKSNFSPPTAPGGRSLPHLCLTPRLSQRPRAAA